MHSTLHAGAPCSCRGPDQHAVRSSEAHSRSHINRPGKVRLCLGVSPTFLSSHVPPWRSTKQHTRRCSHAMPVLSGCPPLVAHNCGVPNTSPLSTVGTQCEKCAPNPAEVQTCHSSTTKQGPALTHMPQQLWQLPRRDSRQSERDRERAPDTQDKPNKNVQFTAIHHQHLGHLLIHLQD